MVIVDDHHLFTVIAGQAGPGLRAELQAGRVFTTASWYYRLARAAHDSSFTGALSRQLDTLDLDGRQLVLDQLDELPPAIGVLSPRVVVPVMAQLGGPRLNLLAAEAVGTAVILDASLLVVAASQLLEAACESVGVELVVARTSA